MRVVCWNMQRRDENLGYLRDTLKSHVALLQEAAPIDDATIRAKKAIVVDVKNKMGKKKNIRNTIYSPSGGLINMNNPKLPYDGGMGFNVASKKIDGFGDVYFIGVYGNLSFWDEKNIGMNIFDIHIIGVLTVYVRTLREKYNAKHIIIAGDFNIDPSDDKHPTYGVGDYNRWSGHFKDIEGLGFIDCLKSDKSESPHDVQTHWNKGYKFFRQLDHFLASKELFKRLKCVKVITDDAIWERSDHRPIVADFE